MSQDNEQIRLFTRRAIFIGGLQLGLFGVLASRLYYLQIIESDKYRTLAEENRISTRLLTPRRGQILDRNGQPLATNDQNFQAIIVSEQTPDPLDTLTDFSRIVPLDDDDMRRILRDVRRARSFTPILVRDQLTWNQVAKLSLAAPDLPGISIEAGYRRSYPFTDKAACHILGYVGPADEDDPGNSPLLRMPGFRVGKSGIEKSYDDALRGQPGTQQLEVNAHGRVVRELAHSDSIPGEDLRLTLDVGLQQFTERRLSQEVSAAATIMDPLTGSIYTMASHPGFDPNLFTMGISAADWNNLSQNEATPLINKAISGQYAPGSTFKLATALAGLGAGIDPAERVFCSGQYKLGDHVFHCWKHGGHGNVDLHDAIMVSCDVYFYDLAHRIGIDPIQQMAETLGLGSKTGVDLPGERAGRIPGRLWKRLHSKEPWQQGDTLNTAIGQGNVQATPLQIAVMASRIVNGGRAIQPYFARKSAATADSFANLPIPQEHLRRVISGMVAVVNAPDGGAHAARIVEEGFEMGGKTGSAQVRHISMAERANGVIPNSALPWKERDHALFVGFAPIDAPRYVCSVIVEHGGGGGKVAAPIAHDLLLEAQKRRIGQT